MTRHRVRAIVIGGGVIGCAVLRELTRRRVDGSVLLEAERDVGEGTSKANSAIVHTGFDAKAGTVEAVLLRRAASLWPDLVEDLAVPYMRVGAIMLARSEEEAQSLRHEVAPAAARLGVATEHLDRAALLGAAPYVGEDATAGLLVPDEAIVDPFWLTRSYAESAVLAGAEVRRGVAVTALRAQDESIVVALSDETELEAELVIDCAGLRADDVARMAGDGSFAITPRKGQLLVSEETFDVDRIVLPLPTPTTKGMLVTPIVFGGLLLGPTAVDQDDKDDRSTDGTETSRILNQVSALVPALARARPVRAFAGLRTVSSTGDYVLGPARVSRRLWFAAGIRSTGISASPAIAERVVTDALASLGWPRRSEPRRLLVAPATLPDEPREVVCLCRGVSRGEIEAACGGSLPPTTMDGLKRRGGATFGHCQGGLCGVDVARILSAERDAPLASLEQSRPGSWIFASPEGAIPPTARALRRGSHPRSTADVVVVGAGRAGSAAAAEVEKAGLTVVVLEHREAATAIGISRSDHDWLVTTQVERGPFETTSRAVVLATGGYVEGRGGRSIGGPRPSGVITAEFAERALDAGILPGRRAVIVGSPPSTAELAERLEASGVDVVRRISEEPQLVHGMARLEGIETGGMLVPCDTLVLSDRRLPLTLLLATTGLILGAVGEPAPADPDGRLPLDGLWAAGCCVTPDAAHRGCREHGARVGRAVTASLLGSAA
jgi:glycerol-3-phosphate dehydrogenase